MDLTSPLKKQYILVDLYSMLLNNKSKNMFIENTSFLFFLLILLLNYNINNNKKKKNNLQTVACLVVCFAGWTLGTVVNLEDFFFVFKLTFLRCCCVTLSDNCSPSLFVSDLRDNISQLSLVSSCLGLITRINLKSYNSNNYNYN